MSTELIAAAGLLADTLTAENAALTALDLPRAAAMLANKQRAVTGFVAAMNAQRSTAQQVMIEPLARRLQALSEANRTLLEQAIVVQGRVIGVIARAALPAVAPAGYSAHGIPGGTSGHLVRPTALALVARA
jgi:hypothetical protein